VANSETTDKRLTRDGGIALAVAAVASIALMMNHPSGPHGGAMVGIVHGGMMLALGALLFGFVTFARARGPSTPVIAGLIAYAISTGAHIGAATINGFAVPALANWPKGAPGHDVFLLAWQLNQGLSGVGTIAIGIAYVSWAIALRRDHVVLAAAGALAGAVPAALLLSGVIRLDVHGALLAYGLHGLWALALGVTIWRGRLAAA
jgi:hypothetical protein